ncbi:MFS transporter [Lacticaseibacillus huelsenbergensis]|uniref:MFS transporter n=1 Tax=Lacticaseibacillus huelsenbergensis TaxID=3035291 RepID=UPI00243440F3|nr:MFS transporter [Lacticaseibacillus huelsenbergensis]WFB41937.1 MFS transporter [Lacticaseibacillus huelsenbergensis]
MEKHHSTTLLTWGILLVGANLRLPITMIPPLLPTIEHTLGLPASMAGLLTTIPLLMFALASPVIAKMGNRRGNEWSLLVALVILLLGSLLRIIPSLIALIVGTLLIGFGISGGNVLLPAIIKDQFPQSIGAKTSLYTVTMGLVASLGTGLAGLLNQQFHMKLTMAAFSLVGVAGLVIWALALRTLPPVKTWQGSARKNVAVSHSLLTWWIALFFGLQSFLYYSLLTWLPSLWQAAGFSQLTAGNLATIFQLSGMPATLSIPFIAERRHGLAYSVWGIMLGFALGALGILIPGANFGLNVIFSLLMGVASGAAFAICIVFFQKKTADAYETASLSGFAQSLGYLFASVGPMLYGFIQTLTGSWNLLLWVTVVLTLIMFAVGLVINATPSIFSASDRK